MIYQQIAVRLPRLLDKDLHEIRRLRPNTQSIELSITPLSTASLTLNDGDGVAVRSFVELYTAKGSAGIYRVCVPEDGYGGGDRARLEHGICTLDDAIVPGKGTIEGTPRAVLKKILQYQTTKAGGVKLWALGDVDAPDSKTISVEHDGTKTLEMLSKVMSDLGEYMLTFDQSAIPWVLHVRKKPTKASCEGRLSRNIRTIHKTTDDSSLCTKLYCSLLDNGYIESDTKSIWGVVEDSVTLSDDTPKKDALAYCKKHLENRKNPTISIELGADEWYSMTGEPLDRFEIGDMCRLALPEYGVTINERIVAMSYTDALGRREAVTVSLANPVEDMALKTAKTQQAVNNLQHTSTSHGNRLNTSETNITNLKDTQEGFKVEQGRMLHWFSSVEVDLDATEESARFGALASYKQVSAVDVRVSEAELELYGDGTSARAGLIARMDDNEAAIVATATDLGTKIELKADITYVNKLVADEIDSAFANLKLTDAETIVTQYLTVKERATLLGLAFDGKNVKWGSKKVISGGSCSFSSTKKTVVDANDNPIGYVYVPTSVTFNPSGEETIEYMAEA